MSATELTIDRLFAEPGLSGTSPRGLKISPDSSRITFLRGRDDDGDQLDLWEYNIKSGKTQRLVDGATLVPVETLSDEEKARRERLRIANFKGIVSYEWNAAGTQLLFPLAGSLYVYDLKSREAKAITRSEDGFATDPKFSPKGNYVSFVRDQNLVAVRLADLTELPLTTDGGGTLSNGVAEFVAQEEMSRFTGYWWSPDESRIAYTQTDEAPVPIERRFEIYADRTEVIEQRYPAAGAANVRIKLGLLSLADKTTTWIDLGANDDIYLARVDWDRSGELLSFQRQSRNQRTLMLIGYDVASGEQTTLVSEQADDWVNLHDDLKFLRKDGFIWSSERSGFRQLQLHDLNGNYVRNLTDLGNSPIDALLAVDEAAGLVYFSASVDNVLEKHIYRVKLDGSNAKNPERLTAAAGWHEAVFSRDARFFVETYANQRTPPQVRVRAADGKERAVLEANAVTGDHPYAPYLDAHIAADYGTLTGPSGDTLHYRMLKPAGFDPAKRYPVFLRTYGGPHVQVVANNWDGRWGLFDQLMAQHGFVVFSLDNRGSDRRGKAFEAAIFRKMGGPDTQDQLAGVQWLRAQSFIDPERIGAFGWSYGGYMTLHMLAKGSNLLRGGVAVAPVTDWSLYDTHYTERYMDHPDVNADGYRDSAVMPHVQGLTASLYLIHGMADDNVLFTNSTALMSALQAQGTSFQLMTYPGEKHGINSSPTQRKHVFNEIYRFFEQTIKGP